MAGKIEMQSEVCEDNGAVNGSVLKFPCNEKTERKNESLTAEYQISRNPEVLEKILTRNQGLLHAVLKRFKYFSDPYEDLLQVANLGLIKAVQRFDCSRGVEFSSYATAVVDGEVRHYLRDNVLMRQPRWLRAAEKRIEDASIELNRKLKRPPNLKELAVEVNISEEGILEILRVVASVGLHPVDDLDTHEGVNAQPDSNVVRSLHYESFALPIEDRIALQEALDTLSAFQRKIVYLLFYKDLTQSQVAEEMGLTQRKVSRESAKALGRLKAIMNTKIF